MLQVSAVEVFGISDYINRRNVAERIADSIASVEGVDTDASDIVVMLNSGSGIVVYAGKDRRSAVRSVVHFDFSLAALSDEEEANKLIATKDSVLEALKSTLQRESADSCSSVPRIVLDPVAVIM